MMQYSELNDQNKVHFLMLHTSHDNIKNSHIEDIYGFFLLLTKNYNMFRSVLYWLAKNAI